MIRDARLSKPRDYGGDMVVEAVDSISIFGGVMLCLSHIVFLSAEEVVPYFCSTLTATPNVLTGDFEIFLPSRNFE